MDPNPDGSFRGWADRLAERLGAGRAGPALRQPRRSAGKLARQVRAEQLDAAVALEPDLASVLSGLNDMLRKNVDVAAVAGEIEAMVVALRGIGADVITVTFPDPVPVNPLASRAAARVRRLNAMIRDLSAEHGAKLVDLEAHPVSSDRRLWDVDRLHANPEGHRRIALAAAEALGLEGADAALDDRRIDDPLGPRTRIEHAVWAWKYLAALVDPAAARRVERRRAHRQAPDARTDRANAYR